jgi:hypothetical protein
VRPPRKWQHSNSHENTNTSRFRRFCCCAVDTSSSHSSTCICDREIRSLKSSPSTILHRERTNKVFGKRSSRLLAHFVKFFITARLPLRRSHADGRQVQRELHQTDRRIHSVVIVKELQVTYGSQVTYDFCSQIMSYIFNILICVDMILLYNLLQCLLFITIIDLSRTCDTANNLICYALFIFIIYF